MGNREWGIGNSGEQGLDTDTDSDYFALRRFAGFVVVVGSGEKKFKVTKVQSSKLSGPGGDISE